MKDMTMIGDLVENIIASIEMNWVIGNVTEDHDIEELPKHTTAEDKHD